MRIVETDPRNVNWEVDEPTFRVQLWDKTPLDEAPFASWSERNVDIFEADLHDVLNWIDKNKKPDMEVCLYVLVTQLSLDNETGALKLFGTNPVRGDTTFFQIPAL